MAGLRRWCAAAYEQLTWAEVSGSLGDLGTFLPLLIALVQKVDLDLGTTLIITGLYNIVSGLQFGIPMCVQPMKTIAAVALAASQPSLTLPQLLLAGIFVSGCVLVLGLTRLIDLFNWLVPPPVVHGVQLAVGTKLAMKGVDMALRQRVVTHGSAGPPQWRPLVGSEGLLVGAVALAGLLATTVAPRGSRAGDPDTAAEDGGLGRRPADSPFETFLRRLMQARVPVGTVTRSATAGGGGGEEDRMGSGGGGGGGETRRLLGHSDRDGSSCSGRGRNGSSSSGRGAAAEEVAAAAATAGVEVVEAGGKIGQHGSGECHKAGGGGCSGGGGGGGRQFPSALVAMVVGLVMAVVSQPQLLRQLKLGPSMPRLLRPSWSDLRVGALRAGLPQLPLTTLNSVIAVSHLANSLFPDRRDSGRWRPAAVAVSVALMNLGGCWLGTMPCCHGAGGLAAQYKFGARSGAAPVLLGCFKAVLGLLFGGSAVELLAAFPQPLLGALLMLAGVELAASIRHTRTPRGYSFALVTAVAILGLDDTGTGFLLGLAAVAIVAVYDAVGDALHRRGLGGAGGTGRRAEAPAGQGDGDGGIGGDVGGRASSEAPRWWWCWPRAGRTGRSRPLVAEAGTGTGSASGGGGGFTLSLGTRTMYDRLEEVDLRDGDSSKSSGV